MSSSVTAAALGFATARILETGMIFTGVVSLLSLASLRQHLETAGANAASLVIIGAAHVAICKRTFRLGQSLMRGMNALSLGSVMYRSRLVPRIIPVVGLIGAPLLIGTVIATLCGILKLGSPRFAAVPVAALAGASWHPADIASVVTFPVYGNGHWVHGQVIGASGGSCAGGALGPGLQRRARPHVGGRRADRGADRGLRARRAVPSTTLMPVGTSARRRPPGRAKSQR